MSSSDYPIDIDELEEPDEDDQDLSRKDKIIGIAMFLLHTAIFVLLHLLPVLVYYFRGFNAAVFTILFGIWLVVLQAMYG